MVAADPGQGGATWAVLQYVLGLRALGHRPVLVEPMDPAKLPGGPASFARSASAAQFRAVTAAFGVDDAALLLAGTTTTVGLGHARLRQLAREADVVLNVAGMLTDERLLEPIAVRVYLDLDPAFTQLWQLQGADMRLGGHTHHVTVGTALGTPGCPVPTLGLTWLPTLPPVALDHWPVAGPPTRASFTSVGNWRSYGAIEHAGVHHGLKAHSLRGLLPLPGATGASFELAFAIHPDERADLALLAAHGWRLVDPHEAAGDPARYRAFVAGSRAEIGIAKSGYVTSRCGWFSDRSACYLASGRPVVAQDTGFGAHLPTGEGLLAFAGLDGAVEAVREVEAAYARHARAARALAEAHLDAAVVLPALLDRVGAGR